VVPVEIVDFAPEYLAGVLALTEAEGWPSFGADPERALRVLTAPGVYTLVALSEGRVIGLARALGDGELSAYLAELAVAPAYRGQGIGGRLIEAVFARCGAIRLDLLSEPESEGFYERRLHRRKPGFRLYPSQPSRDG
jgi:ribosomal protein S18 acetylase RimI-like enzyme